MIGSQTSIYISRLFTYQSSYVKFQGQLTAPCIFHIQFFIFSLQIIMIPNGHHNLKIGYYGVNVLISISDTTRFY
jgi:hypothetical protein